MQTVLIVEIFPRMFPTFAGSDVFRIDFAAAVTGAFKHASIARLVHTFVFTYVLITFIDVYRKKDFISKSLRFYHL